MKYLMIFSLSVLCLSAGAQNWAETDFYEVRVDAVSPEVDANDFPEEGYERSNHQSFKKRSSLPIVAKRDQAFAASDLLEEVKEMDDLDRDRLWFFAGKLSLGALIKRYPNISQKKLEKLQAVVSDE